MHSGSGIIRFICLRLACGVIAIRMSSTSFVRALHRSWARLLLVPRLIIMGFRRMLTTKLRAAERPVTSFQAMQTSLLCLTAYVRHMRRTSNYRFVRGQNEISIFISIRWLFEFLCDFLSHFADDSDSSALVYSLPARNIDYYSSFGGFAVRRWRQFYFLFVIILPLANSRGTKQPGPRDDWKMEIANCKGDRLVH